MIPLIIGIVTGFCLLIYFGGKKNNEQKEKSDQDIDQDQQNCNSNADNQNSGDVRQRNVGCQDNLIRKKEIPKTEEQKQQEEKIREEQEKERLKQIEQTKIRREKILSVLNPKERADLEKYLQQSYEKSKNGQDCDEGLCNKCLIEIFIIIIVLVIIYAIICLTHPGYIFTPKQIFDILTGRLKIEM